MKNGIPNQKYRAKRMLRKILHDFTWPCVRKIVVVTYFLDRTTTYDHIIEALRDADVQHECTGYG